MLSEWTFEGPKASVLADTKVNEKSDYLKGKVVALLVTGGIAAIKVPFIARELRRHGAEVHIAATERALDFVTTQSLEWSSSNTLMTRLSAKAEHLNRESPYDLIIVAPATYCTINKMAAGIADNLVTTMLATSLSKIESGESKVLIAPAMHGDFNNALLRNNCRKLCNLGVDFIPPRDENGKHNLADTDLIVAHAIAALSRSPLKRKKILVTGGSTPTLVDDVRMITNRFRGRLSIEIAKHLTYLGADVRLLVPNTAPTIPRFVRTQVFRSYDEYKEMVLSDCRSWRPDYCVLAAAVADYRPDKKVTGKIPSGGLKSISLTPTEKVVDLVIAQNPELPVVSFKLQIGMTNAELAEIAAARIKKGHYAVVANQSNECGPNGEQVAHLVTAGDWTTYIGKPAIARGVGEFLERSAARGMSSSVTPFMHEEHLEVVAA